MSSPAADNGGPTPGAPGDDHASRDHAQGPGRDDRPVRVLVAGVGNMLRGDDGFGPAVVKRLGPLPEGTDVVETGIGGIALLQELMAGCDGLILIDASDQGAPAGTVFLIEPEVEEAVHVPDVHLANPDRVLAMAKTLGALPERVAIVGCQPAEVDELLERLSPAVERAVGVAVAKVEETVHAWLAECGADRLEESAGAHQL